MSLEKKEGRVEWGGGDLSWSSDAVLWYAVSEGKTIDPIHGVDEESGIHGWEWGDMGR